MNSSGHAREAHRRSQVTMERRKLMKDGILTPDAPKGRIHEAKRALDAVLTQQEKILP